MANEKIEEAKRLVRESKEITGAHKDSLMDVLMAGGKAANGSKDKVADTAMAIESLCIYTARDADHRPADFRRILREEVPKIFHMALEEHRNDCPLYQKWDGKDRRDKHTSEKPEQEDVEPTLSAKSKWFSIRATGSKGFEPAIRLAKTFGWIILGIALIYNAREILGALRENRELLQRNSGSHQVTPQMIQEVSKEVESLRK